MRDLDIAEVSQQSGVPASALRFYEEKGLIKTTGRRGLRRLFDPAVLQRLALIALGRAAGFSLDEISEILRLSRAGEAPCDHVLELAQRHLAAVDERIKQLRTFRNQLNGEVQKWRKSEAATCDGLCQFIVEAAATDAEAARAVLQPRQLKRPIAVSRRR